MALCQEEMTLQKAIALGLENNYGIKIADTNIEIAENNNTWARAGSAVTLDLNGSFNHSLINNKNPASFIRGSFYSGSLGASLDAQWIVLNGGRFKLNKAQLNIAVDQQILDKETGIQDLLRTVYQQYYEIIFQQERLIVLQENLDLSVKKLDFEQTKKSFGASNSYNLLQFENAIISDSINYINQEQLIEVSKRNLYTTLNIIGFADYTYNERLSVTDETINEKELKSILSERNLTLKSLQMLSDVNSLNTQLEKRGRRPTLSLSGSLGLTENGFKILNPDPGTDGSLRLGNQIAFNLGANFNWNLIDGGNIKTNVQNAKLQEEINKMSILEAKAQLDNQLDILIANYNNQKLIIEMSDKQIKSAERNLEMTEERFKAGQINSLDYRNVQSQYLASAFNKVNAIYDLIITKSEIDFLVGKFE